MTLEDLQILVKECASKRHEARRFTYTEIVCFPTDILLSWIFIKQPLVQKNQAIWLALKILVPQGFPLQPCWVGTPPISQTVAKSPPIIFLPPPHQIFTFSPWKPYSNLSLLEVGDEILKTKNGNKSFQQKNNSLFLGNPYKIFSLWCTLLQELNSFYSPTKNLEIPVQLLISNEGC